MLSFYANVYIPTVVGRSDNWKEQIKWAMDKYVIPEFGRREIDTITRADAQRFFNKIGKDMKPSSLARIKIVFSGVMNLAESDELIPRNHVPNVKRNTIMVTLHHETKLGVFERTGIGIYKRGRNFDSVAFGQAGLLDESEPRKVNLAGLD